MNPTDQTILHDPANGKHGNCLSAVLSALLHLPIEIIPVFSQQNTWIKDLNAWLRPYGLAYVCFLKADFDNMRVNWNIRDLHHEVAGPSPRFSEITHACVALDGNPVFDPHPDRSGISEVDLCGVFITLRPWEMLR